MNILILTSRLEVSSGWGRYSLDLVEFLRKNGHTVLVVCAWENNDYEHIKQIQVLPSPTQFKKTHFLSFAYAWKLKCRLNRENFIPDLIHCVVEPYAPVAFFVSTILRVPYVITCHGSFAVNMFNIQGVGLIQRGAFLRATAIVCVSSCTKNKLLSYLPQLSLQVIHNGIDLERFIGANSVHHEEPLILGVGALKERKGFDLVLAALPKVLEKVPNARYVIIGDQGDKKYFDYLVGLVKKQNLGNRVTFLEHVSEETLRSYYQEAKVFILTPVSTSTNFEGFGLVYIEAGVYGLPVIGSYGNGGEDAIIDGKTGFLALEGETWDISEKIIKILTMSNREYEEMSVRARARAKDLSWDNVIKDYLEVYKRALNWHKK